MKFNLETSQLMRLVKWIVSLNLIFLAGTFIFHSYLYKVLDANWENGSSIKFFVVQFSLANENVLATWYSSMLFLTVGIIFLLIFLVQKKNESRRSDKNMALGWLLFSGIFILLSLDEMASLHERLGNVKALNPLGDYALGWIALLALPIALVVGFMIWFCLLQIKRSPPAAIFAVAGILLFASIPVQEYFEVEAWHSAVEMATWQRPVKFLLLEEGSELFGATFMLVSGILFAHYNSSSGKNFSRGSSMKLRLHLHKINSLFHCAAGGLVLTILLLAIVNNGLLVLEGDHGKRGNWFPAATAFLSSMLCLYLYLNPEGSYAKIKKVFLYLSIFCIFISAYYGGNIYAYMYSPKESLIKIAIIAFVALTTLVLALKLFLSVKNLYTRTAFLLWVCLLIPALAIFNWYSALLTHIAFSILSVAVLYLITSKVPVSSPSPITKKGTAEAQGEVPL